MSQIQIELIHEFFPDSSDQLDSQRWIDITLLAKSLEKDPEVQNLIKLFSEEAVLDDDQANGTVIEPAESEITRGTIRVDSLLQKSSNADNVTAKKTLMDKRFTADVSQLQSISEMQELEKSFVLDMHVP